MSTFADDDTFGVEGDGDGADGDDQGDPERYTPVTQEIVDLMWRAQRALGGTWRAVAARCDTRLRVIRRMRNGERRTISMTLLDRVLSAAGLPGELENFPWYTKAELIHMGIWDTPMGECPPGTTLHITPEMVRAQRRKHRKAAGRFHKKRQHGPPIEVAQNALRHWVGDPPTK